MRSSRPENSENDRTAWYFSRLTQARFVTLIASKIALAEEFGARGISGRRID